MSWIDKVKEDLVIITGDGKSYKPQYIKANKVREYNTAEFNFNGIAGSYINRKLPIGRKYNLELIFQGVNHLDDAAAFEESTDNNTMPWQVSHPYYGALLLQPSSLQFDNSELNVSRILAVVFETISIDKVNDIQRSAPREIVAQSNAIAETLVEDCAVTAPAVSAAQKGKLLDQLSSSFTNTIAGVKDAADANKYLNEFNKATSIINTLGAGTTSIAQSVQRFTAMPFAFADSIQARMAIFKTQFSLLQASAATLFQRNSKKLLELQMGSILAAASQATVTDADYDSADDVLGVLDGMVDMYNGMVDALDSMSTGSMVDESSYIPNYDTAGRIQFLVAYVQDQLLSIAQQTKVKHIYHLEQDYTLYELAHKLYGVDAHDEAIHKLVKDNNLSHQTIFLIPKDTEIIYYK